MEKAYMVLTPCREFTGTGEDLRVSAGWSIVKIVDTLVDAKAIDPFPECAKLRIVELNLIDPKEST